MLTIEILTSFFMWCTLINLGLMTNWILVCMLAPDLVYKVQSKFFPLPQETFNVAIYSFLGLFKIVFIVFNLVPYLVLLIIG